MDLEKAEEPEEEPENANILCVIDKPRKFHEQRSLQSTVHEVAKGRTQLSDWDDDDDGFRGVTLPL